MRKIIILLLCCGVLIGMVGCDANIAPPPTESPPTTVSETIITETPTKTIPPITALKPTESLAAEYTEPKVEEVPKEEELYVGKQCPEVDPADIERLVIEKINAYRIAQGDTVVTMLTGLTEVARYRAKEVVENFSHRAEQSVCNELKYGEYIDLAPYGLPGDSYYHGYSREAIGMGDWFGTAESMAERIASGFRNSQKHWSYVGSSEYKYIAVGVTKANDKWYVCILMSDENYGG